MKHLIARGTLLRVTAVLALVTSGLVFAIAQPASAVNVCGSTPDTTWDGDASTVWSDAANWSNGVPSGSSTACVPADMPNNPIIGGGFTAAVDTIEVQIGATLNINGGSLTITNDSSIATLTLNGASTQLTTNGDIIVDTAFNITQGTINGSGSITSLIGANIATTSPKTIDVPFTNEGILTWNDGDVNFLTKAVTNSGQWRIPGTGDTIVAGSFLNSGTMTKTNAGNFTIDADFTSSGTTTVSGTATFNVPAAQDFIVSGGTTSASGAQVSHGVGAVAVNGGSTYTDSTGVFTSASFTVGGGTLSGIGTYVGDVTVNSGTLTAGTAVVSSTGSLDITGNLTYNGGSLRADIRGTAAGSSYDTVAVSGNVTINGGQLDARGNGYNPSALTSFNVLTYTGITGTLALVEDIIDTPFTGYYTTDYGTSPLTLTAHYNGNLRGNAFVDNNSNGVKDGGENTPKTGVTVYLDYDNDNVVDGGEPTRGVDGNGNYAFDNIPVGTYNVRTTGAPFGWVQSTSNPQANTVTDQGTTYTNFGFYESISIAGNVYNDNNFNGINDAGDSPSSGVGVYLDLNSNGANNGEPTVTTDGSGNYIFSALGPGTYNVRLDLPAGGVQTTGNPGATTVASGNSVSGINFGIDVTTGSIAGKIYIDTDGDGARDGGENATPAGSAAFLDTDHDGVVDSGERLVALDGSGNYNFTRVMPGTYDVDAVLPTGYTQTSPELDNVVVGTNVDVTGQDIGLFEGPIITGTVYSDIDSNTTQDAGEDGLAGIPVFLDLNDDGDPDMGEPATTTNASGTYSFVNVGGGTYKVRVTVPSPGTQTTANPGDVVITSGSGAGNVDFGLLVTGDLEGTVFRDTNGNGVQDPGETTGLSNVDVFLDTDHNGALDPGEPTDTTDSNGDYSFTSIPSNNYDVDVVLPTDETQTSVELDTVAVGVNATTSAQDVGLFTLTSISGSVYEDANEDGDRDSGEAGMFNFDLYIDSNNSGTYTLGEPQAQTDANGDYTFSGVGPGPNAVRAHLPPGATSTTPNPVSVPLTSNTPATAIDFGIDIYGTISGTAFVDTNGNGTRDGGETGGLANASVFMDADHDGALDAGEKTVTTDVSGAYTFTLVLPGNNDIDVVLDANYTQTTPELNAVGFGIINTDLTGNDIGVYAAGVISGTVYYDADENQTQDVNEPGIKGATAYFDDNSNGELDPGERKVSSNENGAFSFAGVGPGPHEVRVVPWISANQTTADPAASVVSSGSTISGITFGLDRAVVGSADPANQGTGYWMLGVDGHVYSFGAADDFGSLGEVPTAAVGLAPTPTGDGYWVATAGGGVTAFGDARFFGAAATIKLNAAMIGITATPTGKGYWLLAADGGVFAYGDAAFYGSTGALRLNAPITAMAATGDGQGYWLVASDGGVFAFGNAGFRGSMGDTKLNKPVVGIAGTSTGDGYLLVAEDGGMFNFGAPFHGSAANLKLDGPIVGIRARGDGAGYWLVGQDGGLFAYGQAPFYGNAKFTNTAPISS